MSDKIIFRASFPAIQSAIKVGDTGMRIQLDVPESEMASAVMLIALRDKVLKVTVEVDDTRLGGDKRQPDTSRDFTLVDTEKTHDG